MKGYWNKQTKSRPCKICGVVFKPIRSDEKVICSEKCHNKNKSLIKAKERIDKTVIENLKGEIWLPVVGFEDYYKISNLGRIMSMQRKGAAMKILHPMKTKFGYNCVTIRANETQKRVLIHRLVAQAFIFNAENKPFVNHKNGIKTDNYVANLEWCTAKENSNHAWANGLIKSKFGDESHRRIIKEADRKVIYNRIINSNNNKKELAKEYNVSNATINNIYNQQSQLTKHKL